MVIRAVFRGGSSHLYQVPVTAGPPIEDATTAQEGSGLLRALLGADPGHGLTLALSDPSGLASAADAGTRPVTTRQSNTSLVAGDGFVVKFFRRLRPGTNPELELRRHLTRRGFDGVAADAGSIYRHGKAITGTLAVVYGYTPAGLTGLQLVAGEGDFEAGDRLYHLRRLGATTALMHNALAESGGDPAFSPVDSGEEDVGLTLAAIDDRVQQLLAGARAAATEPVGANHASDIRAVLRGIQAAGATGRRIRVHGALRLEETLLQPETGGWTIIDFEGEVRSPIPERRKKRSPLFDVAGMLRSIARAAAGRHASTNDWPRLATTAFLGGYLDEISGELIPRTELAASGLIAAYQVEHSLANAEAALARGDRRAIEGGLADLAALASGDDASNLLPRVGSGSE